MSHMQSSTKQENQKQNRKRIILLAVGEAESEFRSTPKHLSATWGGEEKSGSAGHSLLNPCNDAMGNLESWSAY